MSTRKAQALSPMLGKAGFRPDYVDATAQVTVSPHDGGFRISKSPLVCEAKVPRIEDAQFAQRESQGVTP